VKKESVALGEGGKKRKEKVWAGGVPGVERPGVRRGKKNSETQECEVFDVGKIRGMKKT